MERWSITLEKEAHKFSAAHFLIFPDGSAERLHGHNYRVFVDVAATLGQHGLVVDFKKVKPVIKELVDELDERWLIPGQHPTLTAATRADGVVEVHYLERYYAAPSEDVIIMALNNISAENLATWIGQELRRRLSARLQDLSISFLRCAVEETTGQRGVYEYSAEP